MLHTQGRSRDGTVRDRSRILLGTTPADHEAMLAWRLARKNRGGGGAPTDPTEPVTPGVPSGEFSSAYGWPWATSNNTYSGGIEAYVARGGEFVALTSHDRRERASMDLQAVSTLSSTWPVQDSFLLGPSGLYVMGNEAWMWGAAESTVDWGPHFGGNSLASGSGARERLGIWRDGDGTVRFFGAAANDSSGTLRMLAKMGTSEPFVPEPLSDDHGLWTALGVTAEQAPSVVWPRGLVQTWNYVWALAHNGSDYKLINRPTDGSRPWMFVENVPDANPRNFGVGLDDSVTFSVPVWNSDGDGYRYAYTTYLPDGTKAQGVATPDAAADGAEEPGAFSAGDRRVVGFGGGRVLAVTWERTPTYDGLRVWLHDPASGQPPSLKWSSGPLFGRASWAPQVGNLTVRPTANGGAQVFVPVAGEPLAGTVSAGKPYLLFRIDVAP